MGPVVQLRGVKKTEANSKYSHNYTGFVTATQHSLPPLCKAVHHDDHQLIQKQQKQTIQPWILIQGPRSTHSKKKADVNQILVISGEKGTNTARRTGTARRYNESPHHARPFSAAHTRLEHHYRYLAGDAVHPLLASRSVHTVLTAEAEQVTGEPRSHRMEKSEKMGGVKVVRFQLERW